MWYRESEAEHRGFFVETLCFRVHTGTSVINQFPLNSNLICESAPFLWWLRTRFDVEKYAGVVLTSTCASHFISHDRIIILHRYKDGDAFQTKCAILRDIHDMAKNKRTCLHIYVFLLFVRGCFSKFVSNKGNLNATADILSTSTTFIWERKLLVSFKTL